MTDTLIKRCNKILEEYEGKLHLVEKFLHIKDKVDKINTLTHDYIDNRDIELIGQIQNISNEILEELLNVEVIRWHLTAWQINCKTF